MMQGPRQRSELGCEFSSGQRQKERQVYIILQISITEDKFPPWDLLKEAFGATGGGGGLT